LNGCTPPDSFAKEGGEKCASLCFLFRFFLREYREEEKVDANTAPNKGKRRRKEERRGTSANACGSDAFNPIQKYFVGEK